MAYNDGSSPTLAELITAKFIPEKFAKDALMFAQSKLVCANLFNTHYKSDLKYGYKVSIPVYSEPSVTEVSPGTESSASNVAGTAVSITVDQWNYCAAEISPMMEIEEYADYMGGAAKACGYAVSKEVDTDIGALFSTLSSDSVYGSDAQTFTDDIFIDLVETLDENDVPDDGRFLIGDPSTRADMLKIDKFVRTDYVRETVPSGKIGMLYGAGVYITNNLTTYSTGHYGVYAHRDAIGVVIQRPLNVRIYDLGWKFINRIVVDAIYGCAEIRDTFGKAFYTRKA